MRSDMATAMPTGRDGRQGRYMARNHANYTPVAVMVFDTETKRIPTASGEDQPLRLWCARYVQRRTQKRMPPRDEHHYGSDPGELAQLICERTRSIEHLWCYTHNLGYDQQSSGLLQQLAYLGWSVSAVSSVSRFLWLTMARHKQDCPKSPGQPPAGTAV